MKITEAEQAALDAIRQEQSFNALSLGSLRAEYLKSERRILERIARFEEKQRLIGEQILIAHGLDPTKADYTIDNGIIHRLDTGAWVPVED